MTILSLRTTIPSVVHEGVILLIAYLLLTSEQCSGANLGKVVEFGDKLPNYISENPSKGWLIKFYTPWCYNCQQIDPIELTYIEVAERIYHSHDDLIVGQVNCDKYDSICHKYNVGGVPTILYLREDHQSKYNGLREVSSMVNFAERMNGPDVNFIPDCDGIVPEVERRGMILLYASNNDYPTDESYKAFRSIASSLKRDHWFYRLNDKTCDRANTKLPATGGIYIVKRNLTRWVKFERAEGSKDLEASLMEFIGRESFPVFGALSNQMMNSTKLLAVAVLDEYGPAKKLDISSKKFYKLFERIAVDEAQKNDHILFAWSTDLHAMRKIALSQLRTPNVILIKPDLSHNLLIGSSDGPHDGSPETPTEESVLQFIEKARKSELDFTGGDTYHHRVARFIYSYVILFGDRYKANPVLTLLMLISMATTTVVLLYKTKTYLRDDDDLPEPQNIMSEANHQKQD